MYNFKKFVSLLPKNPFLQLVFLVIFILIISVLYGYTTKREAIIIITPLKI